jgi:hypothetical protein
MDAQNNKNMTDIKKKEVVLGSRDNNSGLLVKQTSNETVIEKFVIDFYAKYGSIMTKLAYE